MSEILLALALEALESEGAREVLSDAVQESGWSDWRALFLLLSSNVAPDRARMEHWSIWQLQDLARGPDSKRRARHLERLAVAREERWARAVAAVLLFGDWSRTRWPGVADVRTLADQPRVPFRGERLIVPPEVAEELARQTGNDDLAAWVRDAREPFFPAATRGRRGRRER